MILGGSVLVDIKNITKSRGEKELLCEVTYNVKKGGVHGIVGASRESVSALLDVICGATDADVGSVSVCGFDMSRDKKSAQRRLGYLSYPASFYEDMTAFEHLVFVGEAKSVPYDKLYKNIKSALELTELEPVAARLIKKLTASERKRLGIASAMLGNPDLIVLNEPQYDAEEIVALVKKLGNIKTVIIASSDISVIEKTCDDLLILSSGKPLIFGTLSDISARLAKNKVLRVTVKGREEAIVSKLRELESVTDCTVTGSEAGQVKLKLEYSADADIREAVFSLFAGAGMPILNMEEDRVGLSDIYLKLCEIEKAEKGGEQR